MSDAEKPKWEWRQGKGHEQQPIVEWWVEQAIGLTLARIAIRAFKRGDRQTFDRIWAICNVGSQEEELATMRQPSIKDEPN